ncbi:hypothetical protein CP8484711_0847A, partial [Chlamydia psittaci 84-8471/1]
MSSKSLDSSKVSVGVSCCSRGARGCGGAFLIS